MTVSDGVSPSPEGGDAAGSAPLNPPLEAEAKCEIRVQFLTFSCTKFLVFMNTGAQLGQYFCTNNSKNPCSDNKGSGGATEVKFTQVYDAYPAL